jgi:DNA-binding CsgD family transcriptional regulator/PAS domain-containing protein
VDRVLQTEFDLIGSIYDAAMDSALWSNAIDRIRRYMGLHLGAIGINYFPGGLSVEASTNIPPEFLTAAAETSESMLALWGGPEAFGRLPLEEPLRMTDYAPFASWAGDTFYERFGRPQGLVDQLALILERSPTTLATFSLGLHESMPAIDDNQIETFRILAPHMRRAALIGNLLEIRSIAAASFEAVLNALSSGIVLVDSESRIIFANHRAEEMLRAGDPIAQTGGRLQVPGELVKGQVARTIAAAASPVEAIGPGSGVAIRREDGTGAIAHVLPLHRRASRPLARAAAAVLVAEPNGTLNLPLEGIRLLYDLRPAEVRVLELIASGLSGRAVADALGVSENTTKTHTLRLFEKIGVHSRAELVQFANDLSLPRPRH